MYWEPPESLETGHRSAQTDCKTQKYLKDLTDGAFAAIKRRKQIGCSKFTEQACLTVRQAGR